MADVSSVFVRHVKEAYWPANALLIVYSKTNPVAFSNPIEGINIKVEIKQAHHYLLKLIKCVNTVNLQGLVTERQNEHMTIRDSGHQQMNKSCNTGR